jgi:AmmeMemoRadiSam system protein A
MDLTEQEQATLLQLAHSAIEHGVNLGRPMEVDAANYSKRLGRNQATFVTLKLDGDLRGCIGKIQATQPLVCDVVENAYSAAFKDNRFNPVNQQELGAIKLAISLLTEPELLEYSNKDELLEKLQCDQGGVILSDDRHVGVFLPVMWSRFTEAEEFVARLKSKAGMAPHVWHESLCVHTFRVESIKDLGVEE